MPWPHRRLLDLLGLDVPVLLAPMAGAGGLELALAVARAGDLAALPCAMLSPTEVEAHAHDFRARSGSPLNLNFFCHLPPQASPEAEARWAEALGPFYDEFGIAREVPPGGAARAPFDAAYAQVVERVRPEVVSFHFGLPEAGLLARVRAAGARVISSATTVEEARWLAQRGCDAVIAMGAEAGGHRASFLTQDMSAQPGLFALLPQMVDAVDIPVIAAGAVADGRGLAAALALGACAVQIGTAYLRSPEALTSDVHRAALAAARDDSTALTNLFTGRPARGLRNRLMAELGPLSDLAPPFPLAASALAPLRAQAPEGFGPLWSGQAAALAQSESAEAITTRIAREAAGVLARLSGRPPRDAPPDA
ncbi:MAG TPA: nitronate monooxygenase family protein [Phenylobacterium sp.]|nr:nitronate monooxygenase family protein [Phenylobacterium sp.]